MSQNIFLYCYYLSSINAIFWLEAADLTKIVLPICFNLY